MTAFLCPVTVLQALRLATFALACLAVPAMAESTVRREVRYYEVRGTTAAAIRESLNQAGPVGSDGERWDGYTRWSLRWRLQLADDAGGCRVMAVETAVDIETTLPRWDEPPRADRGLARRWQKYLSALTEHEDGHGRIGEDTAAAIRRSLVRLPAEPTCAEMSQAANVTAEQAVHDAALRERQYDRETRHGATQGARFP